MMSGLDVFDKAVEKSEGWLKDIMYELMWNEQHKAYLALRATLHSLRDRLTLEEVTDLGAQLPMLIRGLYYEGWNPSKTPVKVRDKEEYLSMIGEHFQNDPAVDPEKVARAVFKLLSHRITEGEIQDIKQVLPKEIEELWPQM